MRILYAVQATGNGHISRALEITPYLQKYGKVDIFMSGIQADLSFQGAVAYKRHGLSFIFGDQGKVDVWSTIKSLKPVRLIYDIATLTLNDYDLIINDFEPVTAWACKLNSRKCIALSHQASFLSSKTPRPQQKSAFGEAILKHYAPASAYIGLHYHGYDSNIRTPIIRSEIRDLLPENKGHITVYLPAYHKTTLIEKFTRLTDLQFHLFCKNENTVEQIGNITTYPVGSDYWFDSLRCARGVIMGSGFEGPSEALFLGKKLLVVPMSNQYEQLCNAAALEQIGVRTMSSIDTTSVMCIKDWIENDPVIPVEFPFHSDELVKDIIDMAGAYDPAEQPILTAIQH